MNLAGKEERVMVDAWDLPTRMLHWVNAFLIISLILLALGNEGMEIIGVEGALREPVKRLHAYTGHLFATTFFLRVIWGFMGNEHARWPLKVFSSKVSRITEENLSERVDERGFGTELRPLAEGFNTMLGRLDTSFARQKQFLSDASHELRTPDNQELLRRHAQEGPG